MLLSLCEKGSKPRNYSPEVGWDYSQRSWVKGEKFKGNMRGDSFTQRVVRVRNELPVKVVHMSSISTFKRSLNSYVDGGLGSQCRSMCVGRSNVFPMILSLLKGGSCIQRLCSLVLLDTSSVSMAFHLAPLV